MNWLTKATVIKAADKAAEVAEQARLQAKGERDAALNAMTYTFADGRTIQTRPQDQQWILGGIELGGDEWVLSDNSKAFVSASELAEALSAAKVTAKQIMDDYKAKI